jgi:hypothetical protein
VSWTRSGRVLSAAGLDFFGRGALETSFREPGNAKHLQTFRVDPQT